MKLNPAFAAPPVLPAWLLLLPLAAFVVGGAPKVNVGAPVAPPALLPVVAVLLLAGVPKEKDGVPVDALVLAFAFALAGCPNVNFGAEDVLFATAAGCAVAVPLVAAGWPNVNPAAFDGPAVGPWPAAVVG